MKFMFFTVLFSLIQLSSTADAAQMVWEIELTSNDVFVGREVYNEGSYEDPVTCSQPRLKMSLQSDGNLYVKRVCSDLNEDATIVRKTFEKTLTPRTEQNLFNTFEFLDGSNDKVWKIKIDTVIGHPSHGDGSYDVDVEIIRNDEGKVERVKWFEQGQEDEDYSRLNMEF